MFDCLIGCWDMVLGYGGIGMTDSRLMVIVRLMMVLVLLYFHGDGVGLGYKYL